MHRNWKFFIFSYDQMLPHKYHILGVLNTLANVNFLKPQIKTLIGHAMHRLIILNLLVMFIQWIYINSRHIYTRKLNLGQWRCECEGLKTKWPFTMWRDGEEIRRMSCVFWGIWKLEKLEVLAVSAGNWWICGSHGHEAAAYVIHVACINTLLVCMHVLK